MNTRDTPRQQNPSKGSMTHRPRLQRVDVTSPREPLSAGKTPYLRTPARYNSQSFFGGAADEMSLQKAIILGEYHPLEGGRKQARRREHLAKTILDLDAKTSARAQSLLEESDLQSAQAAKDKVPQNRDLRTPAQSRLSGRTLPASSGASSGAHSVAELERMIKEERIRREHAERELLHTLAAVSGSQRHVHFSSGDIRPIQDANRYCCCQLRSGFENGLCLLS